MASAQLALFLKSLEAHRRLSLGAAESTRDRLYAVIQAIEVLDQLTVEPIDGLKCPRTISTIPESNEVRMRTCSNGQG